MAAIIVYVIFIFLGLLSLISAIFNWEWFYTTNNARFFIKWFGRGGARIFYAILGVLMIFMGIFLLTESAHAA